MSVLFQGKLAENLDFGHVLEIGAKAENEESWFRISLATGKCNETDTPDIGLQMLVNLSKEEIAYKQQLSAEWQDVDSEDFDTAIFRHPFRIIIAMDEKKFHVAVNGESQTILPYVVPVNKLNTLKIEGNLVTIKQVDHRKYFPSPWPLIHMNEEDLQFSQDIPIAFQRGHVMVITMKLLGKMDGRFNLDFRNVNNSKRSEVHVSVRFRSKTIVRNSKIANESLDNNPDHTDKMRYGYEETRSHFPFDDLTKTFKIAIGFTESSLKMAKDGAFLFEYAFRTPNVLPYISGVKITGLEGLTVRVIAIDHFRLDDPVCDGFEQYSDT